MKFTLSILFFILSNSLCLLAQENESLKRGVYLTFENFKNNTPNTEKSFYVKEQLRHTKNWEDTYAHIPKYNDSKVRIEDFWGFCDGKNKYIFFEGGVFILENFDGQLGFYGYASDTSETMLDLSLNKRYENGFLISDEMEGQFFFNKKDKKILYFIDKETGIIIPQIDLMMKMAERKISTIYIYRKGEGAKKDLIYFSINDSLYLSLAQRSIIEIQFSLSDDDVQICFNEEYNECLYLEIRGPVTHYVQASYDAKEKVDRMNRVLSDRAKAEIEILKRVQKRRNKNNIGKD